jgi:hypothetical protein
MYATRHGKRIAAVGVLVGLLFVLWIVRRYSPISPVKDLNSVLVVLQRTNCLGSCPVYTLTIRGNGVVEYSGQEFVRVRGPQIARIDDGKINELLLDFDRAHFFALTESFLMECTDLPHVIVTITAGRRSKRVEGDEFCPENDVFPWTLYRRVSRLNDFLALAREIDAIAGSDRWVKCSGRCRRLEN